MRRVTVTAYDVDGALLEAAQLHPEWERPRTAFIVDGPQLPSDAFTVE
jgi:predicted glycosyltransferase